MQIKEGTIEAGDVTLKTFQGEKENGKNKVAVVLGYIEWGTNFEYIEISITKWDEPEKKIILTAEPLIFWFDKTWVSEAVKEALISVFVKLDQGMWWKSNREKLHAKKENLIREIAYNRLYALVFAVFEEIMDSKVKTGLSSSKIKETLRDFIKRVPVAQLRVFNHMTRGISF